MKVIPLSATPISRLRGGILVAMFGYDLDWHWAFRLCIVIAALAVTACCALGWEAHLLLKRE